MQKPIKPAAIGTRRHSQSTSSKLRRAAQPMVAFLSELAVVVEVRTHMQPASLANAECWNEQASQRNAPNTWMHPQGFAGRSTRRCANATILNRQKWLSGDAAARYHNGCCLGLKIPASEHAGTAAAERISER
mmetsp:Transcript_33096/g.69198  ORF Transcript_33096/g.69198 Transcript_33096/m.69198 type:complete len:133 (+) Transcript_33096:1270-1668(+)